MNIRMVTEREARALREDAASSTGDANRKRIGVERRLISPHRVRVRIGEHPSRDTEHMSLADLRRANEARAIYLKRPPVCRSCGQRIQHGEKAVAFQIASKTGWHPVQAYLHEVCP